MILIDNIHLLKKHYPDVWKALKEYEDRSHPKHVEVMDTKKGVPTLLLQDNHVPVYIHSKYDPYLEAERLLEQYTSVESSKHVFFYGIGLGYHIEAFTQKYPDIPFSIYEPSLEILHTFLSKRSLDIFPISMLKNIFVEQNSLQSKQLINKFVSSVKEEVLFIVLPAYERVFKQNYKEFVTSFREAVRERRSHLHVNVAFEQRWTINSIINLETTLNTPNVLREKKGYFQDKPAIIVSAGPSLEEEIENLRYIKENRLAYIFSVGSAINALLSHGIEPDAACTYDPTVLNQRVFEKVVEQEIKTIPLIYGTSVGFETVKRYPGQMFHMITSQDTISPFYLNDVDPEEIVNDSPSIAVITLQLLHKFGCNPIILVGQNLAFKNDRVYSKGIEYEHRPATLTEPEKKNLLTTESVDGEVVYTNEGFNRMRKQMEALIAQYQDKEIINTTRGGAKINGTSFIPLDQIIKEKLTSSFNTSDWCKETNQSYSVTYTRQQSAKMMIFLEEFPKVLDEFRKIINEINQSVKTHNVKQLENFFTKFDKVFKKMQKNQFYQCVIRQMNRVQFELVAKEIEELRFERDTLHKGKRIASEFGAYVDNCTVNMQLAAPLLQEMHQKILQEVEATT
ncbi:motility associated factor glycosyltransferase family protein [Brevibacillus massiliensis]|uniref:motility associated factor glycosyltransferase family protein n=1 Tax=Brevibacillus massiliensis TaxID=1118054 RepID=UPI00031A64F3|nr:6-hydroxymethylpterin diphosphokinase MptE-like protein [Brevibacillus massiliensis]